jgi:pSer/pThr/pTyr-binding forkhead associated (FHA) protein
MENPVEEDYHTANHFSGDEEDGPGEGTPVGEDPRKVSKEFVSLEDGEEEDGEPEPEEDDDNPDATRAGPPVSFQIIDGPDKGKKRRFKGVRMVVGRAKGVDFRLNDQSVSRRHLELVHGDKGTVLRDLVSASGTKVNDERVEECTLKHGDVISLGKTSIKYVDELEAVKQLRAEQAEEEAAARKEANRTASAVKKADVDPNDPRFNEATNARFVPPEGLRDIPTRRPGKKDTKVLVFGGLGVAAVVFVVVLIIVMANKEPPPPPPPDPKETLAMAKMQGARTAIREGNFADAIRLIEEAENLKPGIDADGQAQSARSELAIVEALAEVRELMGQQRYEDARQKLTAAPEGVTAKSAEAREALDKELTEAEAAYYTKKLDELIAAQNVEEARPLVDKLPANAQPLYRQKLVELQEQLERQAADEEQQLKTNKVLAAKRAAAKRAQFVAAAFDAVERKFENGDYERAVLECDRVVDVNKGDNEIRDRARNLKRLIPQFARTYQDAQRKVQAGSLETAVRPLRKAEELYRQIGFQGPMLDSIREQLAESSIRAGKAAVARRDIATAGGHFREALRLNPGDTRAQEGLDGLQEEAENLFQRAYIERDRDPRSAAEKFRIVIDTAPDGSELKSKAQRHLQELEP